MTPEQREGGIVPARLATAQGQLQRARGETRAAIASARQAAALAWLSHSDQALALAASAQAAMCGALGEASMDCLRLRLSAIDTRLVAGDLDGAARELGAVAAALAAQPSPPLQASADTFSALHALLSTPDAARLARLEELLSGSAARGGLAARNALRMLLLAAQELDRSGHSDLALEAAHTALLLRAAPAAPVGMDAALLSIWQARIDARPAPEAARHALALALGETHPWVVSGPARP